MIFSLLLFRTIDSVDDFLRRLFVQDLPNDMMQHTDISIKGAYLKDDILVLLFDYLKSKDPECYDLVVFIGILKIIR